MSQQSNPATLREAATEIDEIADALFSTNALRGRQLRNIAMRVKRVALAASGTEAAPNKAMLALESLTPGGSEYVGDIKRCVETVRETRRSQMEQIVKLTKRVHELEAAASPEGEGRIVATQSTISLAHSAFKGLPPTVCGSLRQSAAPSGGAALTLEQVLNVVTYFFDTHKGTMHTGTACDVLTGRLRLLAQESKTGAASPLRNPQSGDKQ